MGKEKEELYCNCCQMEVDKVYSEKDLCEVCYYTFAGHVFEFPTQTFDQNKLVKTIAQCTNLILKEIKKGKE